MKYTTLILSFLLIPFFIWGDIALRDNLGKAKAGDFIVTAQNKTYTVLLIQSKEGNILKIEEITVPITRMNLRGFSWRNWIQNGAPENTSWVRYTIDLKDASMKEFYSFTKRGYYQMDEADNFLSRLLNLQLQQIPDDQRKKIGPRAPIGPDRRRLWQPQMVIDGECVSGVNFSAWKTRWPKDQTEMSEKTIEIFIPEDDTKYPSYFPYWLQISGMIGKAKIRIVDSGMNLQSPKPAVPQ